MVNIWHQTGLEVRNDRFTDSAYVIAGRRQMYRVIHPRHLGDDAASMTNPWLVFKDKSLAQTLDILVQEGEMSSAETKQVLQNDAAMPQSDRLQLAWEDGVPIIRSRFFHDQRVDAQVFGRVDR